MSVINEFIEKKKQIEKKLAKPGMGDKERAELAAYYSKILPIAEMAEKLLKIERELKETEDLLKGDDTEIRELAQAELLNLKKQHNEILFNFKKILVEDDSDSEGNAIVEIRAGAGGEEAAIFAHDLFKMYAKYAEAQRLKVNVMDSHPTPRDGFKEIVFMVEGKDAYKLLHLESGVHRVQRVPVTESGGRIHTSTSSVVVLPEFKHTKVEINPDDLKIDTFRASGPGGQYVNRTDSAVRITHMPTGIVVVCREERSQYKNKEKAMRLLKARLYDMMKVSEEKKLTAERRSYIGSGDRSEKIRTYNFPQNRVTDHRIGLTIYKLSEIMDGNLDLIIKPLLKEEERRKIESIKIL